MRIQSAIGSMFLLTMICSGSVVAQDLGIQSSVNVDSSYIKVYKDELSSRLYLSRKQNTYSISQRLLKPGFTYKTNDNLLLGAGGTYSFLTLNLAVKLPLINADDELYGSSKYVDLQTHTMFRSFLVDLYLQWNRGYYFSNPGNIDPQWVSDQGYPIRGDMRTTILGLNIQYLFNASRFSYKAAFLQNEFQRKSAGSPIVGVEAYWMLALSDSSFIPFSLPETRLLDPQPFNQADMANIGLNGGYAYTFVWNEKLFLSLSSVLGISGGYHFVHNMQDATTISSGLSAGVNNLSRISMGFNNNQYYVGFSFIVFSMNNLAGTTGDWVSYRSGNFRFNIVRRFKLKKSIKFLRPDLWDI